jgi:hypothetical protein
MDNNELPAFSYSGEKGKTLKWQYLHQQVLLRDHVHEGIDMPNTFFEQLQDADEAIVAEQYSFHSLFLTYGE